MSVHTVVARRAWLLAWVCCSACATTPSPVYTPQDVVPERARTVGDELAAIIPAGADVLIEVDIARLRGNSVVGPVIAELGRIVPDTSADGLMPVDLSVLRHADAVVLCAYHVGEKRAVAIMLIRSTKPLGTRIDKQTFALGPPAMIERVLRVREGAEPALVGDRAFMTVRTRAMPARATGASVRVTARLDFDARVALAGRLDVDIAPETLSVWADVADDFALVATMRGVASAEGDALARALVRGRDRLAEVPWVRSHYLHFTARTIDVSASKGNARAVLIIGPRRLQNMISRLVRMLGIEVTPQRSSIDSLLDSLDDSPIQASARVS